MRHVSRILSFILVAVATLSLAACGGSGASTTAGAGAISLTSISPNPILGCAPTAFTITGVGFETYTGTTAKVVFTATGGAKPFGGSDVGVVTADVTGPTTITGVSPEAVLCGVASVSVSVDVILESGVKASTTGAALAISIAAPTVTAIGPNPIPAAVPTAFTISGTGFTPGAVTVRFTSANPGDINFVDGTANTVNVQATATTSTTIVGQSPLARACTANFTSSIQVNFPDGCCSIPTGTGFVTFVAPAITSGGFGVSSLVPTALVLAGTNFGVTGEVGVVRLSTVGLSGSPIFGNGSFQTIDIPGTVGGGGSSVAFTTPVAAICTTGALASLRWIAPRGSSCAVGSSVTFSTNTITSASAPTITALAPVAETFTFSSPLPPVGTSLTLVYTSTSAGTPQIFNSGTARSHANATAVVASATTVTVIAPAATLCGIDTATASVTAFWPGGSCSTSAAGLLTYQAPALAAASPGGIQNPNLLVASFPNNNLFSHAGKDPFVLNALPGRSFGLVGAPVQVRFSTTGTNIWQGGSRDYDTVIGQVTSGTTITGATPANVSASTTILSVSVQAFWTDGSCSSITTAQFVQTNQRTFAQGSGGVSAINQNGTSVLPTLIGAPIAGLSLPAIDQAKNRLYAITGTSMNVYDTSPTMLGVPVVPSQVGASVAVGANPRDIAVATDGNIVWVTNGTANTISVISQGNNTTAFTLVAPAGSTPGRLVYNSTAKVMVVAFNGSSTIALFDAITGSLNALFAVPSVATAAWNGVIAVQPGASGAARAYMMYDDPSVGLPDAMGTLAFSTGVITTVAVGVNEVSATSPNGLVHDSLDDTVLRSFPSGGVGGSSAVQKRNASTLAVTFTAVHGALGAGSLATSVSYDPVDDTAYMSDSGVTGGLVWAFRFVSGSFGFTPVTVTAAAKSVSTTP